jgi:hypothetical protein
MTVVRLAVVAMLACALAPAQAQAPEAIALASTDPGFRAALADALAPAGMTVVAAEATPPSLADLTAGSRELADREHATGTVWLIAAPGGATLVAYDRNADRVLVRELPYTIPLGARQAAEAARMTRTMLRALRAMPESEQPPKPPPPPAVVIHAPPPPPSELPAPTLAASAAADLHLFAPGSDAQPALSLAAIWRPRALGLALSASLAPSADVMSLAFAGSARDSTLALTGRFPLALSPRLAVVAEGGAAFHFVRIQGVLVDGEPVDQTSVDPAIRIGGSALYTLRPGVDLGLGLSVDTLLRRQMYDAGSSQILIISRIQAVAGAFVVVQIL